MRNIAIITALAWAWCAPAYGEMDDDWSNLSNEAAQDQIEQLSSANRALFVNDNLNNITEPSQIHYKFVKTSTYEDDFQGDVTLNIRKIDPVTNRKDLTFRYLKGRNRVRFVPQLGVKSNPLFILFLERDAREMQRITGGNALFFRTRIRHGIAAADAVAVQFPFEGKSVDGLKIEVQPFADAELSRRFPKYREKTYTFLLSEAVPGGIYQIRAHTVRSTDDKIILDESLTYHNIDGNSGTPTKRNAS